VNHHRNTKSRARSKSANDYGVQAGLAYNDNLRGFVKNGRVREAAEDARAALDGPEAPDLLAAEQVGKHRADTTLTDRVLGLASRLRRAALAALHELRS
jgi:hypothetical protein